MAMAISVPRIGRDHPPASPEQATMAKANQAARRGGEGVYGV